MKNLTLLSLSLGCLALAVYDGSLPEAQSSPPAGLADPAQFSIDPVHSGLIFRIEHMGVSAFYGRFTGISGEYTLDAQEPKACKVVAVVDTSTVDSFSEGRDKHICGPDFLNSKQFPNARFESTQVTALKVPEDERNTFEVRGKLELHGVTREVVIPMVLIGEKDLGKRMGYRSGLEGKLIIDRREFGMDSFPIEALGAQIELTFFIEGVRT